MGFVEPGEIVIFSDKLPNSTSLVRDLFHQQNLMISTIKL